MEDEIEKVEVSENGITIHFCDGDNLFITNTILTTIKDEHSHYVGKDKFTNTSFDEAVINGTIE